MIKRILLLAVVVVASCTPASKPGTIGVALPERVSALTTEEAAQLVATIEIPGFLAETPLTIAPDLKTASGSFTVDVKKKQAVPFTVRLRWRPDDNDDVLLARLAGTVDVEPHKDNAVAPSAGDFDTCGADGNGNCSLEFNLNRNKLSNLDDLVAGFDPRPPPGFADVAPSDLAFPSGIRLGTFARQVIVVENTSAQTVDVSAQLIDAPGATLSLFESDPTASGTAQAQRGLDLGALDPFQEVLVAVSFAPVNPFLTVGDVFISAKACPLPVVANAAPTCADDDKVEQATRVRLLANVDGELQPPPADFQDPAIPDDAGLGGFSGTVQVFPSTSLFNGLPLTSVASGAGAVPGLPFTGAKISAQFDDGSGTAVAADVPADHAFIVSVPKDHKLAVSLSGLSSDVDLAVFLLDNGAISTDFTKNLRVGKAGTSAEAVEHANESGGDEQALVVIGRVELAPPPAVSGGLTASDPAPFSLSSHVTSAPEFTAPLLPNGGPLEGGTHVTLRGKRFDPHAQVSFADAVALDCQYSQDTGTNEDIFDCTVPPGSLEIGKNPANIVVANPSQEAGGDGQAATLPEGFTYEPPAPRLDQLVPAVAITSGSGSDVIVLKGAFFSQRLAPPKVFFDETEATPVTFVDSTRLQVPAPAHAAGPVAVFVQNVLDPIPGQTDPHLSLQSNGRNFNYISPTQPPPTFTAISPATGSIDGDDLVHLTGTHFLDGATVLFDGVKGSDVIFASATELICHTPARDLAGDVDVEIIDVDGQRASLANGFHYFVPDPTVATAFPDTASTSGGTFVIVGGSGFRDGATVTFDDGAGHTFTSPSANRVSTSTILAATPALPAGSAGNYTLTVTNVDGRTASFAGTFHFLDPTGPAPRVDVVSPSAGPNDTQTVVTITGASFRNPAVLFGTNPATVTSLSDPALPVATMTVLAPTTSAVGPVVVRVIDDDGQSANSVYTYFTPLGAAPRITAVSPNTAHRGDALVVSGFNFDVRGSGQGGQLNSGATLSVAGLQLGAQSVTSASGTSITFVVPDLDGSLGAATTVAIELQNSDGQSTSSTFTYVPASVVTGAAATIDSITPDSSALAGGGSVVLHGSGFDSQGVLRVSGAVIAQRTVTSSAVTFTAPAQATPGVVVVSFTNPGGAAAATIFLSYTNGNGGGGGTPGVSLITPTELHALVPGDVVTVAGQGLASVTSAFAIPAFAPGGNPLGSFAVDVLSATDLQVSLRIHDPLPDDGVPLELHLVNADSTFFVTPPVHAFPPRVLAVINNGTETIVLGDHLNPIALDSVELDGGAQPVPVAVHSATETFLALDALTQPTPGVNESLDFVYRDVVNNVTLDPISPASAPLLSTPPIAIDSHVFGEVIPAHESMQGRTLFVDTGKEILPAFGDPAGFEMFDSGGAVVASGDWSIPAAGAGGYGGEGEGTSGNAVELDFTSTQQLLPGDYGLRLASTLSTQVALVQVAQGFHAADRGVNDVSPTAVGQGDVAFAFGTGFFGDDLVVANVATGAATTLGTAGDPRCTATTPGCLFQSQFLVSTDGLATGDYRICVVAQAAAHTCATSNAVLTVTQPSICGDGTIEPGEQCDDGNQVNNDGCSSSCIAEIGQCPSGQTFVFQANAQPFNLDHATQSQTIDITDARTVRSVIVDLGNVSESRDGNLQFSLTSSAGSSFLVTHRGGLGSDFQNTILADICAPIASGSAPFSGCFAPEESFAPLIGGTAAGSWTLQVDDATQNDPGVVFAWGVGFCVDNGGGGGAVCGNGTIEAGENCDDGNNADGDGCSSSCQVEPGCPAGESFVIASSGTVETINDLDTTDSTVLVNDARNVRSVRVHFDHLQHGRDSDLILTMISPVGQHVQLSVHEGGAGADFVDTEFNDLCAPIGSQAAPFTGCVQPDSPLSGFIGSPFGTWDLEMIDNVPGVSGQMNAWEIGFCVDTCNNDGTCEAGEDSANCPNDCSGGGGTCNFDSVCDSTEDSTSCPGDCAVGACNTDVDCGGGQECNRTLAQCVPAPTGFIDVDTPDDAVAHDGHCSLREAILAVHEQQFVDTCSRGIGNDTIQLPVGPVFVNGFLPIDDSLTVQGVSAIDSAIVGDGSTRLFDANFVGNFAVSRVRMIQAGSSAIRENNSNVTVTAVEFVNNTSSLGGGAIFVDGGQVFVNDSAFENNVSPEGGAILVNAGTLIVSDSMFSGNFANFDGGALSVAGGASAAVSYATFSGNSASSSGSDLFVDAAATVSMKASIIADGATCHFAIASFDFNVITSNIDQCPFGQPNDINGVLPSLGPPQNNGAFVDTIELLSSPGIDDGETGSCTTINGVPVFADPAGTLRPQNGVCDRGAFEVPFAP